MDVFIYFAVAVVCVLLASVLAAADSAFSVVSHHEIHDAAEDGARGGERALKIVRELPTHINVITFVRQLFEANAVVFIVWGYVEVLGANWKSLLAAAVTGSVAIFVIAGVSPRTIGRRRSLPVALALAGPVAGLRTMLGPLARVLVWLGNMLTPDRVYRDGPFVTQEQLRDLVERASAGNIIEDDERDMIERIFTLSDTRTYKVMVPRTDVVTIDTTDTLGESLSLFFRSGFSRIPVVNGDIDEMIGVLYLKDVSRKLYQAPEEANTHAGELARTVPYVPETKPVADLLREMQHEATHVAVVIDEYGGTAGIITIEDIVEEIVGEIADEYDSEDDEIVEIKPGVYRVDTRMLIDDLAEFFDVRIDEDDVSSVGGLLTTLIGKVPIEGSRAECAGLSIEAEPGQGRRHRVHHVIVKRIEEPDEPVS